MRPVYFLLLASLYLTACSSRNAKDGLPFTKDSLMGNWMVIRVDASLLSFNSDRYTALLDYKDSVMKPLHDHVELAAFNFQPAGVVTVDDGAIDKFNGQWYFNDNKQLLLQYKYLAERNKSLFTVTHYWNDSLRLENALDYNKDTVRVLYILKKLRSNDSVPNLFDAALNKWRTKPVQPETDAAIKTRLKQVLLYYSGYFANISGNKIPYFNIEKLLCPIKFYSGGIGMKKFNAADEWTKVFYDSTDAHKAHAMLDNAFSNLNGYPDRGRDYVQEYVAALKMVADGL